LANRIGIDLDNTILKYDEVFHFLALEQSWIDRGCIPDKNAVKKGLSEKAEDFNQSENRWQQLQAWAYGSHIEKALVFDGFFGFVRQAQQCGDRLFIVSHKTEFSNFDPSVPLRDAALNTLEQRGFFKPVDEGGLGFEKQDVLFASSLDEKIQKIKELNLTHFIDDLSKVIGHRKFPIETKGILFAPLSNQETDGVREFQMWKDIKEYIDITGWLERSFEESITCFHPLSSSGNNRIYKVEMKSGQKYVVKQYLQLEEDSRPRLQAEFEHLGALWEIGLRNIPQPFVREESRAVYSLIEGMPVKSVGSEEMARVLSFLSHLSDVSSKLSGFSILPGSDSRTCLGDYIDQIEKRYDRIILGATDSEWEKETCEFMTQSVLPHKVFIFNKFYDSIECLGWNAQRPFLENEQMFCPSDLGFHNILSDTHNQGELFFLDFEYSGWDDPAKLLADFFHHVGQQVSWEHKWYLLEQFAAHRKQDPDFLRRWQTVIDLIGLEWVLIVLNVVDPNEMERKRFANPNLDPANLIKTRLAKADQMIQKMTARMKQGEECISIPSIKEMVTS
jgi:thiamine kinase-like enzyme